MAAVLGGADISHANRSAENLNICQAQKYGGHENLKSPFCSWVQLLDNWSGHVKLYAFIEYDLTYKTYVKCCFHVTNYNWGRWETSLFRLS